MFACLFKPKKPKEPSPVNDYSKHLPDDLYDYLSEHHLLFGNEKTCTYTSPNGAPASAVISVSYHPGKVEGVIVPGQIILRIAKFEDNKHGADVYNFTNKFLHDYVYSNIVGGVESRGSIHSGFGGLEDTKKNSPKEIKKIIKRLDKLLKHKPVVEPQNKDKGRIVPR